MSFLSSYIVRPYRTNLADYLASRTGDGKKRDNRITGILDLTFATETGRELIEHAAGHQTIVAFPRFPREIQKNGTAGTWEEGKNTALMNPAISDDHLAATVAHELCHSRQDRNLIGKNEVVGNRLVITSTVNNWYGALVAEADAFTNGTINAYELHLNGIKAPWAALQELKESFSQKPLADALIKQLAQGASLYADETKQAIFNAWMTKGALRQVYELKYARNFRAASAFLTSRAYEFSCSNDNLRCIAADNKGHSYLEGVDLTQDSYVRSWKAMKSPGDIQKEIDQTIMPPIFKGLMSFTSECVKIVENTMQENNGQGNISAVYLEALATIREYNDTRYASSFMLNKLPADMRGQILETGVQIENLMEKYPFLAKPAEKPKAKSGSRFLHRSP